jgi:two-component system, NarL family, response regulator NreC
MSAFSLIVADARRLVRYGLCLIIQSVLNCTIVGEAANGDEALALAKEHRPKLLVADLMLPGLPILEVTRRIHMFAPEVRVMILADHADEPVARDALLAGATAYVQLDSSPDEFLYALRQAGEGRRYLPPSLADLTIDRYLGRSTSPTVDAYNKLTTREREVLFLAADGLTSAEIAGRLRIGVRTVEWHRSNGLHKLGLHNLAELVRYMFRRGGNAS